MVRKLILLLSVLITTCGFVSWSDQIRDQLNSLPQQYANFDVKIAWDLKTAGDSTIVEGVVQNIRYATMEDLEIWVTVVDAKGKTVQKGVDYIIPSQMKMNDAGSFKVKLATAAPQGSKLLFTYKYNGFDGGDGSDGGGIKWMQSFEAKLP